jgi:hypothetical protein
MQVKIDIETRNIIRDSKQYHIIKTLKLNCGQVSRSKFTIFRNIGFKEKWVIETRNIIRDSKQYHIIKTLKIKL